MHYVFGDFSLDTARYELRRAGQVVPLRGKVFDVLAYLMTHDDRVVSRDELLDQVWPEQFVAESTLTSCIKAVRQALGDTRRSQHLIKTVHGRGYRCLAPVTPIDPAAPEATLASASPQETILSPHAAQPVGESTPEAFDALTPSSGDAAPWPDLPSPTSVSPASVHPCADAECRPLTVLVCDLAQAARLVEQSDPEDLRQVMHAYHTTCERVLTQYEGYLAQRLGSRLVVYFGYPQAQEDAAQRAVLTALGLLAALSTLDAEIAQRLKVTLGLQVGIDSGLVVVETGGDERAVPVAIGRPQSRAVQLQERAAPQSVVISFDTQHLVQGWFRCDELSPHVFQGSDTTVPIYQVMGRNGVQHRLEVLTHGGLTPLVGREHEVGLLSERWQRVCESQGQVVVLSGEAGIGKSRLVQVLKEEVIREPHVQWECRSSPYYQNTALHPITELLQRVVDWQSDDTLVTRLDKLEAFLSPSRLAVSDTAPLLASLLSIPLPETLYPPLNLSPQRQRQKTLESLVALVLEQTAHQPVLLILEDLHWTDPTTLELLDLLIDQVPTASILILLTYRPEFQPTWGRNRSYLTHVTLHRLSPSQIESIAMQVAAGKALPDQVLEQIVARTDGVPLYIEEMTKMLLESGHLKEVDAYQLTTPLPHLAIPMTLRDSLMARLDRLDSAKRVAQLGAVIGRQFEYTLLRAVWEQDETRLQQELDLLVKVELVYQQGIAPQATYVFKHVLIQEAAYQSLLRRTRRRYHQRIAQTLHTRFPDTAASQPELLAHHYTEAGLALEAVPYWQNAGWKALRSSAHQEAVAHFRKGLEVLSDLPETPARNRLELDLLIALGPALMATEGFSAPDLIQTYSRAHELCQHMEATPQYTQALMGLWQFYVIRSELDKAQELASQLYRLAHQLQALALLPTAYRTLGKTAVWQGDFSSARTFLEQGAAVYDPRLHRDHALRYGLDPGVVCLGSLAWSLWHLGYPDQARQKQHEALGLARELSHPFSLAFALCVAAMCFEWCGDLAAVRAYGDEAVALATEQRFPFWMAIGMGISGFASVCLGQATEGIVQLRQGYELHRSTGAKAARLWFLNILTRAALQMNNLDEANAMSNAALVFMETTEERFSEVESYWLQGKLRLAQATSAHELQTWAPDIEAWLVRAQRAARRQQMKSWELRIAIDLRELWQSQGRSDEAQRLLAEVYKTFTEGWDTADLQQAKALLAASP